MTREERDKAIRILQWLHDNNFLFRSTEEDVKFATEYAIKALEQEPFINKPCVSSGVCEHDKNVVLDKVKAEIKEWYWQVDKQELAKDPCVVDAMIDLFIRTINKYKAESEDNE